MGCTANINVILKSFGAYFYVIGWQNVELRIRIMNIFVYCGTASKHSLNGNEIDFMKHIDFH